MLQGTGPRKQNTLRPIVHVFYFLRIRTYCNVFYFSVFELWGNAQRGFILDPFTITSANIFALGLNVTLGRWSQPAPRSRPMRWANERWTLTETAVVSLHLGLTQQSHGGREKAASVVAARLDGGVVKAAK